MKAIESLPWATIVVFLVFIIIAIVGGIVTIQSPTTLSFKDYLDDLEKFAIGAGLLGVGRGIYAIGKNSNNHTRSK